MKLVRIYVSAGIFIALTALRMLLPTAFDGVTAGIAAALDMEKRHTEVVMDYASTLDTEKLLGLFHSEASAEPQDVPKPLRSYEPPTASWQSELDLIIPTPTPEPTPEPSPEPTPEPTVPPAVTAFLASQETYSAYEVPQNVSYAYPELPFEYLSPVAGTNSSGFGYRLHPIKNEVKFHYGTDLAACTGTPICAFADGTVRYTGENDSYGKYVMLDHAGGYSSFYAHCSEISRISGSVKAGEEIARVGQTGAATGPHLHFELMQGSTYLNPEFYI